MSQTKKSLNPTLDRIADSSSEWFAPCVKILSEAIPAPEQLPLERLATLLARGDYRLYSLSLGKDVVGMALLYLPQHLDFAWLDYIAIRADYRNQGLGSTLSQELVRLIKREKATAHWLLFEVDDDREGPEETRRANRRRITFYQRLGAQVLVNVPYRFPTVTAAPVPMRLMVYRLRPTAALSPESLSAAVEDVFLHVHDRASDDSLLRWILDRMPSALILE